MVKARSCTATPQEVNQFKEILSGASTGKKNIDQGLSASRTQPNTDSKADEPRRVDAGEPTSC